MESKVRKQLLTEIQDDIEKEEKQLQYLEGYHSPCGNPELDILKQTCHPLTFHKSHSFTIAKKIRTPYDKDWLKIYNGRVISENFCLTSLELLP